MAKKIYVGNLPYKADEESLRELFSKEGEVQSVRIITDETGRSKGFGFVEMANDEEAEKAISSLNGYSLLGRNLVVNEARPQTTRPGGKDRGQRGSYGRGRDQGWR